MCVQTNRIYLSTLLICGKKLQSRTKTYIYKISLLLPVEKGYASFTVLKIILYAFMKL